MKSDFKEFISSNAGNAIYEGKGETRLEAMIPIKGTHNGCNVIFAQAMRRICGDYLENKCDIIPDDIDEEINKFTQTVLYSKTLMSTLNEVIEQTYKYMYENPDSLSDDEMGTTERDKKSVRNMRAFDE